MRCFNYALIQQVSICFDTTNRSPFFSYSVRNYTAITSERYSVMKRERLSGEILKGFFVTVEIERRSGWNIFRNLINGRCGIKMPWVGIFLKMNKQGEGVY